MALTTEQLELLDETGQVRIETRSDRGTVKTIIWIVVIDREVYVRSVDGDQGRWYRRTIADPSVAIHVDGERIGFDAELVDDDGTIEAVSEAIRDKYPPSGSVDRMTRPEVLSTTLRLVPAS